MATDRRADVTWKGSLIGLAYGSVCGFILGWSTAFLRNLKAN